LRIVMGILVDHLKPKKAGAIGQIVVMAGLLWAWLGHLQTYESLLLLGIILGVGGAAFAAALPLASRWYPPEHQGTALGIAGAGNSGTAIAALFAPALADALLTALVASRPCPSRTHWQRHFCSLQAPDCLLLSLP
jgi:NNP family nitrate/nitrite transporter-like MFS transporter